MIKEYRIEILLENNIRNDFEIIDLRDNNQKRISLFISKFDNLAAKIDLVFQSKVL